MDGSDGVEVDAAVDTVERLLGKVLFLRMPVDDVDVDVDIGDIRSFLGNWPTWTIDLDDEWWE